MSADPNRGSEVAASSTRQASKGGRFAQFLRFCAVGVLNTLVYVLVYRLAVSNGVPYPAAAALAYCFGIAVSFVVNRQFTFRLGQSRAIRRQFARFVVVNAVALAVNVSIVVILVRGAAWNPDWAVFPAIAGSLAIGFLGSLHWAFVEDENDDERSREAKP